jgi:hypothetical protein
MDCLDILIFSRPHRALFTDSASTCMQATKILDRDIMDLMEYRIRVATSLIAAESTTDSPQTISPPAKRTRQQLLLYKPWY